MGLKLCKAFFFHTNKDKDIATVQKDPEKMENNKPVAEMTEVPTELPASPFAISMLSLESIESGKSKISIVNEQLKQEADYIEEVICNEIDIVDNEMKEFNFSNDEIVLLIKQNNKLAAISYKCECGSSLKNGKLGYGRVRCPIYGTCYNFKGELEQFPGLDPILAYEVKVQKGLIKLRYKKVTLGTEKAIPKLNNNKRESKSEKTFVIIGGGKNAVTCAEVLRQNSSGRIYILSKDAYLPYDRSKLTKMLDAPIDDLRLRNQEFYEENAIEVLINYEAQNVDTKLKLITLANGDKVKYDKLYIATGSNVTKTPEMDFKNVLALDDFTSTDEIIGFLNPGQNVVICGSSFWALELASFCATKNLNVTILDEEEFLFSKRFGYDVSCRIAEHLRENKVQVLLNSRITKHSGNLDYFLESIELEDGTVLKVDLMILTVGMTPNTEFLKDSGITINDDRTISTNQYLQTNIPDVYVGGSILSIFHSSSQIGHSGISQYHGKIAAQNMLGKKTDLRVPPFYWFEFFGKFFTYVGLEEYDSLFVDGDIKELKINVYYFDNEENLTGVLSCRPNNFALEFADIWADEKKFTKEDLEKKLGKRVSPLKKFLDGDLVEATVCKESDIGDNETSEFDFEDLGKVLLIKLNGQLYAIGTKCSHCGSRLVNMALGERRVRCSPYGTSFAFQNEGFYAEIEEFPGLDCIPAYKVRVEADDVIVKVRKSFMKLEKVTKPLLRRDLKNEKTFVVIGGGPSAATCVEILRQYFTGRIVMISKEPYLPYDRTNLQKMLELPVKELELRSQKFYDENSIETWLDAEVQLLDSKSRQITLVDGKRIKYDKLYIAPGAIPRRIPGVEFKNVFTLRSYSNAQDIKSILAPEKKMVILGLSHISLELAAYCVGKVAKVTLVGKDSVPFKIPFGDKVGARIKKLFEEHGVEFQLQTGISQYFGDGKGYIRSVQLATGASLVTDILVMAIGLTPNTNFLRNSSGIFVNQSGSITTNQYLQSNVPEVYVGGEVASTPKFFSKYDIGHSGIPQYHGKVAALNMAGIKTELKVVPYFWVEFFGKTFTFAGDVNYHSIHVEGHLDTMKFVTFYFNKQDNVVAVCSCQPDLVIAQYAEMLADNQVLRKQDLELHFVDEESD